MSAEISEEELNQTRVPVLNFNSTKLGSFEALGNNFVVTFMICRAFGGRDERNRRAVLAFGENGLKTVETSVMNLVIMVEVVQVILQTY